jgi:hypothetical protein
MSFISVNLFYRFSNICQPWLVKHGQGKNSVKYCWIVSLILILVNVCLDQFSSLELNYAGSRDICFIEPEFYLMLFFIGPVFFLISVNMICFVVTIYSIHQARPDETNIASISDRAMALIFAKVGSIMGVTWLFALVPFLTGVEELWYIFVVLNGLQGVYIFLSSGIIGLLWQGFRGKAKESEQAIGNAGLSQQRT